MCAALTIGYRHTDKNTASPQAPRRIGEKKPYFSRAWPSDGTTEPFPFGNMVFCRFSCPGDSPASPCFTSLFPTIHLSGSRTLPSQPHMLTGAHTLTPNTHCSASDWLLHEPIGARIFLLVTLDADVPRIHRKRNSRKTER